MFKNHLIMLLCIQYIFAIFLLIQQTLVYIIWFICSVIYIFIYSTGVKLNTLWQLEWQWDCKSPYPDNKNTTHPCFFHPLTRIGIIHEPLHISKLWYFLNGSRQRSSIRIHCHATSVRNDLDNGVITVLTYLNNSMPKIVI